MLLRYTSKKRVELRDIKIIINCCVLRSYLVYVLLLICFKFNELKKFKSAAPDNRL